MAFSGRQKRGQHWIIREYLSSESFWPALQKAPEPHEPVVQFMLDGQQVRNDQDLKALTARAERISLEGMDPEVAILFLINWSWVSFRLKRFSESTALLHRSRALFRSDTPPEVLSAQLANEAAGASAEGRKADAEALLKKCVDGLSVQSPRYAFHFRQYARFLAHLGREDEVDDRLGAIGGAGGLDASLAAVRLVQMVETCRLDEAAAVSGAIVGGGFSLPAVAQVWHDYSHMLGLMRERWCRVTPGAWSLSEEQVLAAFDGQELAPWARAIGLLLLRRPEEALAWARREEEKNPELSVAESNFTAFTILRSELSCGNAAAARRIIDLRHAIGNVHYLDDLFLARAALLDGDCAAARKSFAVARRSCLGHCAEGRLDLELRLSCELSPDAAVRLALGDASEPRPGSEAPTARPSVPVPVGLERLLGSSRAMVSIREAVRRFAPLETPVLVTGETGTGKELVARAIHEAGPRAAEPFVAVNCGAIAEGLLESELFGHERGAFTGAEKAHRGFFEEAGRGTVLLDEIGEISPRLQVSLLRVLETGEIRPVGASRSRRVQCRMVAATNADLGRLAEEGRFRNDLIYRLRRLEINIPPLRERQDDVLLLAGHFLAEGRYDGRRPVMSEALRHALLGRSWPGNVRELRNVIERMRLMSSDRLDYDVGDLEPGATGRAASSEATPGAAGSGAGPPLTLSRQRRMVLDRLESLRALFRRQGRLNRADITRTLGISPPTATQDLRALCAEGLIEKIAPTASPRTHYFRLKAPPVTPPMS